MTHFYILLFFVLGFLGSAQAEIYKRVDADGHVTYSSTPLKGSQILILSPLPKTVAPARTSNTAPRTTPNVRANSGGTNFPRVDTSTQKKRDNTRKQILHDELASEESALREARLNLQKGVETPEVYIDKDGKVYSDTEKQQDKLGELKEQIRLHENNINALKSELSRSK
ncbi:MAG: DUF4124 domain-containing protein [Gallionellaceae bacterium]|jgi:hypothetical protein